MEILKGFSFDLQRFAVDLRGNGSITVIAGAGNSITRPISEQGGTYVISTDGDIVFKNDTTDQWTTFQTNNPNKIKTGNLRTYDITFPPLNASNLRAFYPA